MDIKYETIEDLPFPRDEGPFGEVCIYCRVRHQMGKLHLCLDRRHQPIDKKRNKYYDTEQAGETRPRRND